MSPTAKKRQRKPAKAPQAILTLENPGRATTIKHIRSTLGRTQGELARALGVSEKTVQSYEQGWRDVPVRVMIQLLVLLALYRKHTMDDVPCWEIRKCSVAQRERCASFTVGRGQFCWFVGSAECHPDQAEGADSLLPCMGCTVIKRLLAGKLMVDHDTSKRT